MSKTPRTDAACGWPVGHHGRIESSDLVMDIAGPFVHSSVARELERENKQLRQTVLETLNQRGQRELIVAWDRAKELERENAALREDKERLDFLGQTKCAYYYEGPCCWRINEDKNTDGDTLRDAIDAARKEGP